MKDRLIQYQCQREGTLFYYQTGVLNPWFINNCPLCGSKRVIATGRTFAPVKETKPALKARPA